MKVGYQFFLRDQGVVCGLDEAVAVLKTCAGRYLDPVKAEARYRRLREAQWRYQAASFRHDAREILKWERIRMRLRQALNREWRSGWSQIKVWALRDGDRVKKGEPVLGIVGNPLLFVHLETPLLGAIARPTATATAVSDVVGAARGKMVLFFSARFDHYWVQAVDGYAALKAGAFAVSTDANADYWGIEGMGTMPHFLIGCYGGSSVEAALAFDRHTKSTVKRIVLVDWDNDCIGTTRKILEALVARKYSLTKVTEPFFLEHAREVVGGGKGKLWGVRFDTSEKLVDRSVRSRSGCGVCPALVRVGRKTFNRWGCSRLKIVVSGGFNEKRIRRFEQLEVPVDAYGVGSTLLKRRIDVTADIVEFDGRPCAKVGRKKGDWSRMTRVR
jgi:nicotinate phosphoribosyltransferase